MLLHWMWIIKTLILERFIYWNICPKYQFLKTFLLGIPCYSTTLTTRVQEEVWSTMLNIGTLSPMWQICGQKLEQIWHDHQVVQLKWKISRFPDFVATRPAIGYLHWLVFQNEKKEWYIYIYIYTQGLIGLEMFFDFRFYIFAVLDMYIFVWNMYWKKALLFFQTLQTCQSG